MYEAVKVAPDVYWVGAIDWNERNFHGYTTDRGSTYNAYLIMDEKITLIDTVKPGFGNEMIQRISQIVDPGKIDIVVSNHVERDHSGSLPDIMALAPNAKVITSDPKGHAGLIAHYGDDYDYQPVKSGDTLTIGKRTLTFVHTPMVHWPDNMVTYSAFDKILFSNDAFGQHLASSQRFDDQMYLPDVLIQAKKYYANIVMPYSKQVQGVLKAVDGLDISMIAPSHGVIWRSNVDAILKKYRKWCYQELEEYALVVYDSMWHSTEQMAESIVEACTECGIPVRLLDLKCNHISDIMTEVLTARYLAVGSPTLNNNMMPTVAAFFCYLKGLSPRAMKESKRIGIPFGSYGWAPAGPKDAAKEFEIAGYEMPLGTLVRQWTPDDAYLSDLRDQVSKQLRELHAQAEA